ncbi:conserved hypothetical protein [Coccidioides posadasii str. Silveira]|uniref:Uncharacterized protein n=1 Tax=Coccidioides posadasii (strain RMSCC 757 / Silveira) TaxID=443226 RepID=E9CWT1_COCPS|nr:conserved hypothetical protein [Coccidioides posadasii str. Silveira]
MHMQPFPNEYARNNHFREGDEKWFGIKTRFKLFSSQPTVPKTNSPPSSFPDTRRRLASPQEMNPNNHARGVDSSQQPSEMPAPLQVPVSNLKGKAGREESPAYRTNTGEIDPGNEKF